MLRVRLTRALLAAATVGGGRGRRGASGTRAAAGDGVPHTVHPGSALLNPRSRRAKMRAMAAKHAAQQAGLEQQAQYADLHIPSPQRTLRGHRGDEDNGSGDDGDAAAAAVSSSSASSSLPRAHGTAQRRAQQVQRRGADLAERAKFMSDAEWVGVPLREKHAFVQYMARLLREHPTAATEQQRRRYFETTQADPRALRPQDTVRDPYERIKLGLPTQLPHPQHTLGVTQAMYDAADASLFDPDQAHRLDDAMTQVKQLFADYVHNKRAGRATEMQRRALAHHMADLNVATQRHLANMFRYAEDKLRSLAAAEQRRQLEALARLRARVRAARASTPKEQDTTTTTSSSSDDATHGNDDAAADADADADADGGAAAATTPRERRRARRKRQLKKSISTALGVDLDVAGSLLSEMQAQERFLQFCEVVARLTLGSGFVHTRADESLDAYTASLRALYSVDAHQLSTLDVVQYLAAKDAAHPVEWARRWYERALLLPLQHTPEYKRLREMQQLDADALALQAAEQRRAREEEATRTATTTTTAAAAAAAAAAKEQTVVHLVEKMFLRPDDARLRGVHEKRLRYVAYLQMERQIAQARANARRFAGIEQTPEAARCRALYEQLLARKRALLDARTGSATTTSTAVTTTNHDNNNNNSDNDSNVFHDAEAAALFEQIRDVAIDVLRRYGKRGRAARGGDDDDSGDGGHVSSDDASSNSSNDNNAATDDGTTDSHASSATAATSMAQKVARVVAAVKAGEADVAALRAALREKKQRLSSRLFGLLEADVRAEMEWLDAMTEAERPPLLPVPEGMSYVSAADVRAWQEVREEAAAQAGNPFAHTLPRSARRFAPTLLGQPWRVPDKPTLFWGTGARAVQQALEHAAADAERRRRGEALAPPYPCPENPWGWRLAKDILDD